MKPLGFKTRDVFRKLIAPYAQTIEIPFVRLPDRCIRIGDYIFDQHNFHELLHYVERGGFPRWRGEIRPDYVNRMKKQISESSNDMFAGLKFD